jgi:hypothetical protein
MKKKIVQEFILLKTLPSLERVSFLWSKMELSTYNKTADKLTRRALMCPWGQSMIKTAMVKKKLNVM